MMNGPEIKVSASDEKPGGPRHARLNWLMGDVNRARKAANLPMPFGTALRQVHDERDTLVVHWDRPESMVLYGQFVIDAWREHGASRVEYVLPDGTRLQLDVSDGASAPPVAAAAGAVARAQRGLNPAAFSA
jgi:hypothetical protein